MKFKPVAHFKAAMAGVLLLPCLCISCQDDYIYDDKAPDNLGASIYDYLTESGEFSYFVRLIDDLEYREVLSRTGSKTLFPADDAAFERFFRDNSLGVTRYEDLTVSQKRQIMNTSMVNMAYLAEMLSNVAGTDGANEGMALRRWASGSYLDNVSTELPQHLAGNPYWSRFANRSLFMVEDAPMIVHFTDKQMATQGMTAEDFSLLYNGKNFSSGDIYVNGVRIKQRDIICKNGYIHVVEDVLQPLSTMAEAITLSSDAQVFSKLLDKFCAPYYNASYTVCQRFLLNQRRWLSGLCMN